MTDFFEGLDDIIPDETTIDTPADAVDVFEKIKRIKNTLTEAELKIKAYLEAQKVKAQDYLTAKREELERILFPLESMLKGYIQMRKTADAKYSFSCQFGSAYIKKGDVKWLWPDNKTLIASLDADGKKHLFRIKQEPDKVKIREEYATIESGIPTDAMGFRLVGVELEDTPDKMVFKFKEVA